MTPLVEAFNASLLHFIWQGIAIGILLWVGLFFLRRSSANSRYVLSCMALVALAAVPLITAWSIYQPLTATSLAAGVSESGIGLGNRSDSTPGRWEINSWVGFVETWVLPAWSMGVLVFALRLAWSCGHTSALRREGTPTEDWILSIVEDAARSIGVERPVRVLMSSIAEVPSVVGWLRPIILLPAATVVGLTPQQLEAVIAHEMAHIRRHDYLVNLMQTVVETLLFYHPVVWWTSSHIRHERELCCDDLAVRSCDAVCYARALTKLEKLRVWNTGLAMNSASGPLFHRIHRLLVADRPEQGPSRLACAVGLLAGIVCLALNMSWAKERPQENRTVPGDVRDVLPVPPAPPVPAVPPVPPVAPIAAPVVLDTPFALIPPTPLPPLPPVEAVPTSPVLAVPPLPPTPPIPLRPSAFFAQTPREETSWFLFRGARVVGMNASSPDEAEARAARQAAGGGDLLWFRLSGKAYVTQDNETLARIEALHSPTDEARAQQRELIKMQEALAEQQRALAKEQANVRIDTEIQADIERIQEATLRFEAFRRQVPPASTQEDLSRLQVEVAEMQRQLATNLQLQSNLVRDVAQRQAELGLRQAMLGADLARIGAGQAETARRVQSQMIDILRELVNTGNAKPVQ